MGEGVSPPPMLGSVLGMVAMELSAARAKHPPQKSLHEGYAVLLEEVDEFWA